MMAKDNYLDLLGITQWERRMLPAQTLVYAKYQPNAKWLFILDKQELDLENPLLLAILSAIAQSADSVSFAYYEAGHDVPQYPYPRYIVAMGAAVALLQSTAHVYQDSLLIYSESLTVLSNNIAAKRHLWQQLKSSQVS